MGNWRALLPIVISLVIAISGSFYVYKWIKKKTMATQSVVQVQTEAVPVAVAALDLPWGTKIIPEMVKMTPYLKESLPEGHFKKSDKLVGRVTLAQFKSGDAIVEHRLAPVDIKTGGVAAVVKPNKRAVAVKGDKIIGIAGFINPGNHVDVLVTMEDPKEDVTRTKIVLENMLVLATGTQIQKNEKGEPMPVDVYTLEVTPEESEKLALSASEGRLQFALRNPLDSEEVKTRGATASQTFGALAYADTKAPEPCSDSVIRSPSKKKVTPAKRKTVKKWKPRQTITVEIIKGTSTTKKKVKL